MENRLLQALALTLAGVVVNLLPAPLESGGVVFFGGGFAIAAALLFSFQLTLLVTTVVYATLLVHGNDPLMIVFLVIVGIMTMVSKHHPWVGQWWMFLIANIAMAVVAAIIAPMLPAGPPVNRKVPLAGSRFSPLEDPA